MNNQRVVVYWSAKESRDSIMLPGSALQPESRDLRTVVAEDRRTKGPGVMGDLSEKTCP